MPETSEFLADRLRAEGARVIDFFNTLTMEQWAVIVYQQDNPWTLHVLLAHFVSSEIGRQDLIIDVASGGRGAPPDFDIDRFNQRQVDRLSNKSNSDLLTIFSQERARLIELVRALRQEDIDRIGNDPFLGEVTLAEIIKLTYRHLQIHLRDTKRCL
jgi:hypothetical protein